MNSIPWIEKYRPKTFDNIVLPDNIKTSFELFIENKTLQHLLFYGSSGTGKTTSIKILAHQIYSEEEKPFMILEINASEERGIDTIRDKVMRFVNNSLYPSKLFKLVILDEADSMTSDAQAILKRLIDNATNARFCFICNKIKYIDPAIQSRCLLFNFLPLQDNLIKKHIKSIIKKDNLKKISNENLEIILKYSKGDMRKIINILQVYNLSSTNNINSIIGLPDKNKIINLLNYCFNNDFINAINYGNKLVFKYGYSLHEIINNIYDLLLNNYYDKILSQDKFCSIINNLAKVEINITYSLTDNININSIVSCMFG